MVEQGQGSPHGEDERIQGNNMLLLLFKSWCSVGLYVWVLYACMVEICMSFVILALVYLKRESAYFSCALNPFNP